MGLAEAIGFKEATMIPYLNTATMFDIATASYVKGYDGKWYANGGVGSVTGVVGRTQYHKSNVVDYLSSQIILMYPQTEVYKLDTEQTMNVYDRYETNLVSTGHMTRDEMLDRVHITNKAEMSYSEFVELILSIGKEKTTHKKDFTIETPFIDIRTGEVIKMMIPTIIILDSISELMTSANEALLLSKDMEDSSANTADMQDGRIKKRLVSAMTMWARRYGIYFMITAHVGEKKELDKYHPEAPQNQWLSSNDKIKSAGNNFFFLPNLLFQCGRPQALIDKNTGTPTYPAAEGSTAKDMVDLNRVPVKILRNKGNLTGSVVPFVISQSQGINNPLTHYVLLQEAMHYGMEERGYNYYPALMPDAKLNRKNIREETANNYRLNRALELTAQLFWMNAHWNLSNLSINVPRTAETLMECITQSKSIAIDDVLESRGYWTYDKTNKRSYMSIFDVCELIGVPDQTSVQVPESLLPSKKKKK